MRIYLLLFTILCLSAFPALAQAPIEQKQAAAIAAAENFLALVDSGQYEASWEAASTLFKSQVSKETWVAQISRIRPIFGSVIKRNLNSASHLTSAPGAPDGDYVLIIFKSTFEHKQNATETITPSLDPDGHWRVSGYFIR